MSFDAILNAQRSLQKALEGPMASYLAQQDKMRKALEGPMASYFAQQEQLQKRLEGPLAAYFARQEQTQKALEGPMASYLAQQDKMRKALEGPMASYFKGRTKMQQALEGPLASLLASQGPIRSYTSRLLRDQAAFEDFLREAIGASDAQVDASAASPLLPWFAWTAVLPTVAQIRLALELMGIAIAVASCAQVMSGSDVDPATAQIQACVGLLVALAGYLLRMAED
jgi:hypothetical protein